MTFLISIERLRLDLYTQMCAPKTQQGGSEKEGTKILTVSISIQRLRLDLYTQMCGPKTQQGGSKKEGTKISIESRALVHSCVCVMHKPIHNVCIEQILFYLVHFVL